MLIPNIIHTFSLDEQRERYSQIIKVVQSQKDASFFYMTTVKPVKLSFQLLFITSINTLLLKSFVMCCILTYLYFFCTIKFFCFSISSTSLMKFGHYTLKCILIMSWILCSKFSITLYTLKSNYPFICLVIVKQVKLSCDHSFFFTLFQMSNYFQCRIKWNCKLIVTWRANRSF